ncbi:head maturation protease, ClpP-related [uncultured Dysosmobacter sp.]|uniref:head maturation protease, ClpP-related n=1 Tax=uncultured Dysosmobacter sp. TaxID=2591384 RepID=UPI002631C998|nr:head maturation protease, ClpP-related [uncultured Dysosmobacter sp.]
MSKDRKPGAGAINPPNNRHFWEFRAAAEENDPPELILYGDIASSTWWGDEVTPREFSDELTALGKVPEIVVRINSGGGDVFAANAIYTRLKDNPAKITVKIDGWAASAATIIAMAGDTIEIPGNGVFMVHNAKMGLIGYYGKAELEKMMEEIGVINNSIVNGYALKTGKKPEEIAAIMEAETWMDGKQAVEAGFCDKLMFEDAETTVENARKVIVNSVSVDLERFPNMPVSLLNRLTAHTSGGFSNNKNPKKDTEKERQDMKNEEIKTVADLKAAFPDLTAQIEREATAAERKRIQDIEDVALAGFENIVNDAKFANPIAAGDVAKAIVAEQKKQGGKYVADRDADAKESNAGNVGTGGGREGTGGDSAQAEIDAAIDALFPETK